MNYGMFFVKPFPKNYVLHLASFSNNILHSIHIIQYISFFIFLFFHFMSSFHASEASANVFQISYILFLPNFHSNFFMLISSDHFQFALHHILQNMNKSELEKMFSNIQQNVVIINNFFYKFDVNKF